MLYEFELEAVAEGSNGFIENLVTELSNPAHIFADYEMNASKEAIFNQTMFQRAT
jgi:hypothetical protein